MRLWPKSVGDRIREAFAFLTEVHGYRLIAHSDGGMGGSLTYRSDALWIAVAWDRGDPWLEFSPARSPAGPFEWDLVDQLLRGVPHFDGPGVPVRTAPVPELAAFLREHLAEIEARFRPPVLGTTLGRLAELDGERQVLVRQWWDRFKRRPAPPG